MSNPHSVLIYLRPTRLVHVREKGRYEETIPKAWDTLFSWLDSNRLRASVRRGYGLARDNPLEIGPQNCRYDACVELRPEFEARALRELGITTLPGGAYACRRLSGNYDRVRSEVADVYSSFVPLPGLYFDENRPIVSIYFDDPGRMQNGDLRADVCVPVFARDEATPPRVAADALVSQSLWTDGPPTANVRP
jgi:AraC family transcriptional regulator